jgi:integrase
MKFTTIAGADRPGTYSLRNNLYLVVQKSGSKSWVFRYRQPGTTINLGLGSATGEGKFKVTITQARQQADRFRVMLADGKDPRSETRRAKAGETFRELLDALLKSLSKGWKGSDQERQWRKSLDKHAAELLPMRVATISLQDVLRVLRPKWGTETMARVQDRIEKVLQTAVAMGLVKENVARWDGHLSTMLAPKPGKKAKDSHAALAYDALPAFIARVASHQGMAAKALTFTILTAARTDEAREMKWSEVDLDKALWTVPAERMKAGVEHIVPLSAQAVELLRSIARQPGNDFVFHGKKPGQSLGATALSDKLEELGFKGQVTVHGFRSTFADWAGDMTTCDKETREHCLAHQLDAVTGAYRRGTAITKRRTLMQGYADYAYGVSNVATLRAA